MTTFVFGCSLLTAVFLCFALRSVSWELNSKLEMWIRRTFVPYPMPIILLTTFNLLLFKLLGKTKGFWFLVVLLGSALGFSFWRYVHSCLVVSEPDSRPIVVVKFLMLFILLANLFFFVSLGLYTMCNGSLLESGLI